MNQKETEKDSKSAGLEKENKIVRYTAKDSVFSDLFQDPQYLFQLYQALHPEDREVTEDSIKVVTMKNVLLDQSYNDLGFTVGEKLLVMVEVQSSWSVNIVVRCFMYLAQTYQEYIEGSGQNVYGSRKLELPVPELYLIYTGGRKTRPEFLYLSKEFFGGKESAVELKVKVIYDGKEGDIINQYVTFTKIYNEQVKLHGRTREAVLETIRICKDQNVLRTYLADREKEVVSIMMTLFNDEYILKTYVESERREAAERATEKAAEEAAIRDRKLAQNMFREGDSVKKIADVFDVSVDIVEQWLNIAKV